MRLGCFTMPVHPIGRDWSQTLREETGDFGELVYAGMDWVDPVLAKRSMQLLAEQVMPRVNAAIGVPKVSAAE